MPEALKIRIDRSICMGSGVCVNYASQTFDQDGEARAFVLDPVGNSLEEIQIAIEGCPTGAISLAQQ